MNYYERKKYKQQLIIASMIARKIKLSEDETRTDAIRKQCRTKAKNMKARNPNAAKIYDSGGDYSDEAISKL